MNLFTDSWCASSSFPLMFLVLFLFQKLLVFIILTLISTLTIDTTWTLRRVEWKWLHVSLIKFKQVILFILFVNFPFFLRMTKKKIWQFGEVALTIDTIYMTPFLFYVSFYNVIIKNFNIYDNQQCTWHRFYLCSVKFL